jgi:transposase
LCDRFGEVLHFHLSPGQAHDSIVFDALMMGADMALENWQGTVIDWPETLAGDKGYRANWIDEYLMDLGITPVIPSRENEDRDTRGIEFDREKYRERNIVERVIGWLKEFRRIFSRFEKTAKNFGGMIKMGIIQRALRFAG